MPYVKNMNNFEVRAKFELHGIPGMRASMGEVMIPPHSERQVATDSDVAGVLTIFDGTEQVYWTNTSGKANVRV